MALVKDEATPIRRQYLDLKRKYADCILFFRLGDFYETFDADAELIARVLDVVLTSRPIGKDTRIPMAGVPHHAADSYMARLIERGYRVAVAEQIGSEPVNGLVPREVRRVLTPGTVVEDRLLDAARPSYLAALVCGDSIGLAYCDITTGEFLATQIDSDVELERELARIQPRELIMPEVDGVPVVESVHCPVTPYSAYRFEIGHARQTLLDHFKVGTLQAYGLEEAPAGLRASGAIISYLREMQPAALRQLTQLRTYSTGQFMGLDLVTRRNLELVDAMRVSGAGRKSGPAPTLLGVLDRTLTPMGARLLRARVAQPLLDRRSIEERLDIVEAQHSDLLYRTQLREALKGMPDLERLTTRAVSGIAEPKDLLHLRNACAQALALPQKNNSIDAIDTIDAIEWNLQPVVDAITAALKPEADEDGFINLGYSAELDEIHLAARDAKTWMAGLERSERERTGIRSLKVGYNKVFGYYIELTSAMSEQAPAEYIRKQTLTNAERYITPQLKEYETLILNADERIAVIERRLLVELNQQVAEHARALFDAAQRVARIDVAASLAEVAARNNYVRPHFNDAGRIDIAAGRHPVIEHLLKDAPYTPNDAQLDGEARIMVLTGPNMSGKSSYMRQTALIVLLAQIGSFVPARSADLCIVDRIFTRIGAQDELTAGQSTFMVEMVETASILHHCTPRSLVILDEIGRGTSTYDGLAIAWSVIEYLHNHPERAALTLFATHYHELIQLAASLPRVRNYNVAVSDEGGRVVFLHKVVAGGADRSYGIHVAQLAGMPNAVVQRAQEVLLNLEAAPESPAPHRREPAEAEPVGQLTMFTAEPPALARLREIDPNGLSPLAALTALFELKKLAAND
ncbi:MAG: DNA mismatch repair protein MutS [Chloroflexi bacterium]|nr:DNA mismatch repair protein MutS [Chloroflexota bacterium]